MIEIDLREYSEKLVAEAVRAAAGQFDLWTEEGDMFYWQNLDGVP